MATMTDDMVEFSEVESFSFLFKCLWQADSQKKQAMHIVDTILYKRGRPARWLFTGADGTVMKRRDDNLNPQEILRMFKSKSKSGQATKHHSLKAKIATVWFVNQKNQIRSYLVDDLQLQGILREECFEVLALQLYIGGHQLKGSGVFEHRMYLRANGVAQHSTHELISPASDEITTYSRGVERLSITETQHNTLKGIARKLTERFGRVTKGRVANIVLQVVFTSSWVPVLVTARSVLLWHADSSILLYRAEKLHALEPPIAPSAGQPGSKLLPHESNDDGHYHNPTVLSMGKTAATPAAKEKGRGLYQLGGSPMTEFKRHRAEAGQDDVSQGTEDEMNDMFDVITGGAHAHVHASASKELAFKTLSSSVGATIAEQKQQRMALGAGGFSETSSGLRVPNPISDDGKDNVKGNFDYNDDNLFAKDPQKQNERFLNGAGRRPLGASATGVHFPADAGGGPGATKRPAPVTEVEDAGDVNTPPLLAPQTSVQARLAAETARLDREAGVTQRGSTWATIAGTQTGGNGGLKLGRRAAACSADRFNSKGLIHRDSAYQQTQASRSRLNFYASQLKAAETLPLDKLIKNRRPISAPHNATTAVGSQRGVDVKEGKHGVAQGGTRSSGFIKRAPLMSGTVCFGDYCFLADEMATMQLTQGGGAESSVADGRGINGSVVLQQQQPGSPGTDTDGLGEGSLVGNGDSSNPGTRSGSPIGGSMPPGGLESLGGSLVATGQARPGTSSGPNHHGLERTDGGAPPGPPEPKPQYDGRGLSQHDLRQPLLNKQVPFRSVLTLRSEEDYLKRKVFEDWEGDDRIEGTSNGAIGGGANGGNDFQVEGHQRNLLGLAIRHLRRVGYCCLSDVRRTVVPLPNLHAAGSGFDMQWAALTRAYRRLIYVDALAKTHPSRFYQTVPVCDTCHFMYSMADAHREDIVLGGSNEANASAGATRRRTQGRKTDDGIAAARVKGRARRAAAEVAGQERNSPDIRPSYNHYSGTNADDSRTGRGGGSSDRDSRTSDNEDYDRWFDKSFVNVDEDDYDYAGAGATGGVGGETARKDESESSIARRIKADLAHARRAESENKLAQDEGEGEAGRVPIQIGISTEGGAISSWVHMLSDTEEQTFLEQQQQQQQRSSQRQGKKRAQSAGTFRRSQPRDEGRSRHGSNGNGGSREDKGNPLGPLSGLGIGGPKGQYRGLSAPVGFMLGEKVGDVGTRFCDDKGNIKYQPRRSPAERGNATHHQHHHHHQQQQQHLQRKLEQERAGYESGDGIAFKDLAADADARQAAPAPEAVVRNMQRPQTAGATRGGRQKSSSGLFGESEQKSRQAESAHPTHKQKQQQDKQHEKNHSKQRPQSAYATAGSRQEQKQQRPWQQPNTYRDEALTALHGALDCSEPQEHLLEISTYQFRAHRPDLDRSTTDAVSAATAVASDSAAAPAPASSAGGVVNAINDYRFDVAAAPGTHAPFLPLSDGQKHQLSQQQMKRSGMNSDPIIKSVHMRDFANHVPTQTVYEKGGQQFEQMLKSAAAGLGGPPRPVSAGGGRAGVPAKERLQRSQELRRLQEEREDDHRATVGYLGGLRMEDHANDVKNIYIQPQPQVKHNVNKHKNL